MCNAQTEKPNDHKVSKTFKTLYNSGKYSEIFNLFSVDMKTALPIEQANDFLKD